MASGSNNSAKGREPVAGENGTQIQACGLQPPSHGSASHPGCLTPSHGAKDSLSNAVDATHEMSAPRKRLRKRPRGRRLGRGTRWKARRWGVCSALGQGTGDRIWGVKTWAFKRENGEVTRTQTPASVSVLALGSLATRRPRLSKAGGRRWQPAGRGRRHCKDH